MSSTATHSWLEALNTVLTHGRPIAPRGQKTLELPHYALKPINMNHPAIGVAGRRADYGSWPPRRIGSSAVIIP